MFNEIKADKTLSFVCLSVGTACSELVCVIRMSPLRRLHGWRAPGISRHCFVSECVGLPVWACVSTLVPAPGIDKVSSLFSSIFLFRQLLHPLTRSSPNPLLPSPVCKASPLNLTHLQKHHIRGTFRLPRRRQIKQGCEGEIPPLSLFI